MADRFVVTQADGTILEAWRISVAPLDSGKLVVCTAEAEVMIPLEGVTISAEAELTPPIVVPAPNQAMAGEGNPGDPGAEGYVHP